MSIQGELIIPDGSGTESTTKALDELRDGINTKHQQVESHIVATVRSFNASIESAYQCGLDLIEAKRLVGHGRWLPWLHENCPNVQARQCNSYVKIAENWSKIQALREKNPDDIVSINGALRFLRDETRQIRTAADLDSGDDTAGDSTTRGTVTDHQSERASESEPECHDESGQPSAIAAGPKRTAKPKVEPSPKPKQPQPIGDAEGERLLGIIDTADQHLDLLGKHTGAIDRYLKAHNKPHSFSVLKTDRGIFDLKNILATANRAISRIVNASQSRPPESQSEPEQTEAERLRSNVNGLITRTMGSIQKDLVDVEKLLERNKKPGFDRKAAVELTEQLNDVFRDLQGRMSSCV